MKSILIVDDDIYIGDMLCEILTREGYKITRAYSGSEAVLCCNASRPDLVLLDLMLPGLSGEEVLGKISAVPVIVMSAKTDIDNKVEVLLAGAVDYITKPFDTKELVARIAVALRTRPLLNGQALSFDCIRLSADTREITVNENEVKLTPTEYAILKLLMQNKTQVVTKSAILELISADTPDCTEGSLKIHISNLRRKLREKSGINFIQAVWGIGFKLSAED